MSFCRRNITYELRLGTKLRNPSFTHRTSERSVSIERGSELDALFLFLPVSLSLGEPFKKISSEMNLFPLLPFVFFVFKVLSDFCFCFSSRPSRYLGVKSHNTKTATNPPSRRDSVTSLHLDFLLDDLYLGYVNVFQSSSQSIQASSEYNLWSI